MVGRLLLWSGYVLFFYVVTHLLNHALGLISLGARSRPGVVRLPLAQPDRADRSSARCSAISSWRCGRSTGAGR
jgi:hypothetical protein